MEFFTQKDIDTIKTYAGQTAEEAKHKELTKIYDKLGYFCNLLKQEGYYTELRKDPRKQAGPGKFVFQQYQWAKVVPKVYKEDCKDKYAYIIGLSGSLHFHIKGVKGCEHHEASEASSEKSWTKINLDNIGYDDLVQKFIAYDKTKRSLFEDTGAALGIDTFKRLVQQRSLGKMVELLKYKKQIILQGPPGTGKTYTAKDIAEEIIFGNVTSDKKEQKKRLEASNQFKLIQFHPAYTYEDFVRGIAVKPNGGNVFYQAENKVLAAFAETAHQNYLDSKKTAEVLSKEKWLDEEFNLFIEKVDTEILQKRHFKLNDKVSIISVDDEAFKYGGEGWEVVNHRRMKFSDVKLEVLADVKTRKDIQALDTLSGRARQHATYDLLVVEKFREYLKDQNRPAYKANTSEVEEEKSYLLIIDEINRANLPAVLGELIYALEYRGESVQSMYELEDGSNKIVLPDNLYIIGTMNTADRSVGHIDYAIRRRFDFVDILPSDSVIDNVVADGTVRASAKTLYRKVSTLFSEGNIASDFKAKDVQLGHSYFLADTEKELELKLIYEILPLLHEYLKDGILNQAVTIEDVEYKTETYLERLKKDKWS